MKLEKLELNKIEEKQSKYWEENKIHAFHKGVDKPIYDIDTPPPFPTGEFHTGNTLNWCYIDFIARYKRMTGHDVLFPQGWDNHGFPTEVKVEKKYGRLPRKEFYEKCLEWNEQMTVTIKTQMKQMGFSIDWNYEYYTLSDEYKKEVQKTLIQMFKQGDVYRGELPVLWSPELGSAVTKAECEDIERETTLNYVKFGDIIIATTRPEYLHACVAIMVHPQDSRYTNLTKIKIPLYDREVPVIKDADVDKEFGSGAVMLCTFGDKQDVIWQQRHKLPIINAIDKYGKVINNPLFNGIKLSECKQKVIDSLNEKKLIEKQDKIKQVVKIHERSKNPIEYVNSVQWFIKAKEYSEEIKKTADQMKWTPDYSKQLLYDWCNGLEWDWCISRQRIFGTPLPFYISDDGEIITPEENELPIDLAEKTIERNGKTFKGETSVCDGWVDSSITPLIVAKYSGRKELPVSLRPQGNDIIRTWAFYTILRCLRLTGKPAFKEITVNGMVLGQDKKKMSKSLGNYIEAKEVIAKAGVDSLRQWAALAGSTGKDLVFTWKEVDSGKSFLNKLWNASKFVQQNIEDYKETDEKELTFTDEAMLSKYDELISNYHSKMNEFDFYGTIKELHSFFWNDFCDYYLEDVKHRIYSENMKSKRGAQYTLKTIHEGFVKLFAVFAPYVTEEIYQSMYPNNNESLHLQEMPKSTGFKITESIVLCNLLHRIISQVRKLKSIENKALNEIIKVKIKLPKEDLQYYDKIKQELDVISKITSEATEGDFEVLRG
ncbi:Isoleucine--tRNA ligase [uncultured archaeon]|nr:Isoleucine--tRNA ligase [uncultured archaeon]